MENNIELSRELRAYQGEKKLTKLAVTSEQQRMKELLLGAMGDDMKSVLNGEKRIFLINWLFTNLISNYKKKRFQLLSWFKRILRKF